MVKEYTDILWPDSSVINVIYYNKDTEELFVRLWRQDVLCGYSNVPSAVWTALKALDANGESVGSYWNKWIKDQYPGITTSDVELIEVGMGDGSEDVPDEVFEPAVQTALFFVHFDWSDSEQTLSVYADSVDDAVSKFFQISKIAGWDKPVISAVTQFFA